MLTDITDRKRVEAQLADQRQYLEEEVERRTGDLRAQAMNVSASRTLRLVRTSCNSHRARYW